MKDLTITMQESDFTGDYMHSLECPGAKAFKRALKQLPEGIRGTIKPSWIAVQSGCDTNFEWRSYNPEGEFVNLMHDVKVGDTIIFKHKK